MCPNGWISFGETNLESFRNYQLPGAGGPSPMVAAFWDDLKTTGNSKVLKYIGWEAGQPCKYWNYMGPGWWLGSASIGRIYGMFS